MRSVNVRDLHQRTGKIVAAAAEGHVVIVLKRGLPVAELHPASASARRPGLPDRASFLAKFPQLSGDSGTYLEEDRC